MGIHFMDASSVEECWRILRQSGKSIGYESLAIAFVGLAGNNALLVIDRLVVKSVDLSTVRLIPAVLGVACLVYGLVWESE